MAGTCVIPAPLKAGDTVAIVSPASIIDPALVVGASDALRACGLNVAVGRHALGRCGTYSGARSERAADMIAALTDPQVKAILCSRGGYGAVHILQDIEPYVTAASPKWLIGFSDISALHALWHHKGIASVHGSMAKHLALYPADDAPNTALMHILHTSTGFDLTWGHDRRNVYGSAQGRLMGGNVAVLADLLATPYSLLQTDVILFVEDIAEPIYKVERIMWQLRLAGILPRLKGLIVGQFTDYRPNDNYAHMEDMIADMVRPYGYPVAFGAPVGHVDGNMPLLESADVCLTVDSHGSGLKYINTIHS